MIDQDLNFSEHVEAQLTKIKKLYLNFRRLYGRVWGMSCRHRLILYGAVFQSIISYCSSVFYERIGKKDIKKILVAQRSALIGCIAGYRTLSYPSTHIISGPIDLKLQLINQIKRIKTEHLSKREIIRKCQADTLETIQIWNERYINCEISGHVRRLIPSVYERLEMGTNSFPLITIIRRPLVDMVNALNI